MTTKRNLAVRVVLRIFHHSSHSKRRINVKGEQCFVVLEHLTLNRRTSSQRTPNMCGVTRRRAGPTLRRRRDIDSTLAPAPQVQESHDSSQVPRPTRLLAYIQHPKSRNPSLIKASSKSERVETRSTSFECSSTTASSRSGTTLVEKRSHPVSYNLLQNP